MKKSLILFCAASAVAAMSCSKEVIETSETGLETQELSIVALSDSLDTKLNSSTSTNSATVKFIPADKMSVFDSRYAEVGGKGWQFSTSISSSQATATFNGNIAKGATPKMALIPYFANATFDGDSTITTTLNSAMAWQNDNSISTNSSSVIGVFDGDSVAFKQVCGYIQLTLPNDGGTGKSSGTVRTLTKVSKVVVRANEQMTGPVEIAYNGGKPLVTRKGSSTEGREITLSLKYFSALTEKSPEATATGPWYNSGKYLIPVIPGKYTGLSITYSFSDGRPDTTFTSKSGSVSVVRAKFTPISNPLTISKILTWKAKDAITAPADSASSYTSFPTARMTAKKISSTNYYVLYCTVDASGKITDRYTFVSTSKYFNTGKTKVGDVFSNLKTIFGTDYLFPKRDYFMTFKDQGGADTACRVTFYRYYSQIPKASSSTLEGAIDLAQSYFTTPAIPGKKLTAVYLGVQYATGTGRPILTLHKAVPTGSNYVTGADKTVDDGRSQIKEGDTSMTYRGMYLSGTEVNTPYYINTSSLAQIKLIQLTYE